MPRKAANGEAKEKRFGNLVSILSSFPDCSRVRRLVGRSTLAKILTGLQTVIVCSRKRERDGEDPRGFWPFVMDKLFSTKDIERLTGLKAGRIRYWQKIGFIRPSFHREDGRPYYTFADLVCFKTVKDLLDGGVSLRKVRSGLEKLERILPAIKRPLARLRLDADGRGGLVVRHGGVRFEPQGQMLLEFSLEDLKKRSQIKSFPLSSDADYWFERGCSLDSVPAMLDLAIESYRKALEIRPNFADALTNLGNIHYHQGEMGKAKGCYQKSVSFDPNHTAANFNLANILEEEGSLLQAIFYYKKALAVDPLFADAHFNLGLVYEKLQLKKRARPHWKRFIQLDPYSEEAALARKFLEN